MKDIIKLFVERNNITELETGTDEWLEFVAFILGCDVDDVLDIENFDAEEAIGILEELDVEVY